MDKLIELYKGQQASQLLRSRLFQTSWKNLYCECNWSTPFQSPGFVITWFEVYANQMPIIVTRHSRDGVLDGLLILAKDVTGNIKFAGAQHAEYKGWLEHKDLTHEFIGKALNLVRQDYGPFSLNLSYIYFKEQAEILRHECAKVIELSPCNREYKKLSHTTVMPSLKKKGNRSKWNRLNKLGCVEYARIIDPDIFRKYLEACSIYHDVWQGAMNNSCPFSTDRSKLDFHAKLFEREPGIFHLSAITLDKEPVALHIGYINDREICYSIIAHNPMYSSHSLGKLLLLRLSELLLDEGFTSLDLSPGDDHWKKEFSTDRTTAYTGVLHKNAFLKLYYCQFNVMRETARLIGISGNRVRKLSRVTGNVFGKLSSSPYQHHVLQIYRLSGRDRSVSDMPAYKISKNNLSDLLLYKDITSRKDKSQFLKECIRRLTDGEEIYTCSGNDRLLAIGWMNGGHGTEYFPEVGQTFTYNPSGNVIHSISVLHEEDKQGLYSALVGHMLADSICKNGNNIYLLIESKNAALSNVIETVFGFRLVETLHLKRCFNLTLRWSNSKNDDPGLREQ